MMKRIFFFLLAVVGIVACADDDNFTTNHQALLSFEKDTLQMDTVFSNVGSSTYTLWVYNRTDNDLRLNSVRLRNGNQTGFRVNVDGGYLDNDLGSVITNLEVRSGDSLRVFVELTSPESGQLEPQERVDDLVFYLESGVEQQVRLLAWTWDALKLTDVVIANDTTIDTPVPLVLYGAGLRVDSGAILTLRGTTLYFHDGAGLDVYGQLHTEGCLFRGDRLDRMFEYLPYDRVSGLWRGLKFAPSSSGNRLINTEIRNPLTGVVLEDSAIVDSTKQRLIMDHCTIHNAKGYGIVSYHSSLTLSYCQLTNTLGDILLLHGGYCLIDHCTLAQFYPFSADRGAALHFIGDGAMSLTCNYSLLTGYADDVVMAERTDTTAMFSYHFSNCLLRTPAIKDDTLSFQHVLWETASDSIQGKQHFVHIDEENLYYDFHLDSLSIAHGLGCY